MEKQYKILVILSFFLSLVAIILTLYKQPLQMTFPAQENYTHLTNYVWELEIRGFDVLNQNWTEEQNGYEAKNWNDFVKYLQYDRRYCEWEQRRRYGGEPSPTWYVFPIVYVDEKQSVFWFYSEQFAVKMYLFIILS